MKVIVYQVKNYPMQKDFVEIDGTLYHTNELGCKKPFEIGKGLIECKKDAFEFMLPNLEYIGEAEIIDQYDYYSKLHEVIAEGK